MFSMTGYGKAEYQNNGICLIVEIKTVNNRNFDFNAKMPRIFISFEDKIRKIVNEYVSRGRVDLFVNFSDTREKPVKLTVNMEKAKEYISIGEKLVEEFNVQNDLTVSTVMRLPDVISDNSIEDGEEFEQVVTDTVKIACEKLNLMRKAEGDRLVSDLLSRMDTIKETREKIVKRAPLVASEYKEKLAVRISEALADVKIDEARLLNEVAFYTDKVNIDEELTRLNSHINQFCEIALNNGEGKKLDFLMQEFNRETNTICSKSNDIEVTRLALLLKNEIEKVREQVQNLE